MEKNTNTEAAAPLFLRVAEAARWLGLPVATCYDKVATGQLPHVRLGSTILIPVAGIVALEKKALAAID